MSSSGAAKLRNNDTDVEQESGNKPLLGMRVVFTGSMTSLNLTRKEVHALAKSMGAKSTPTSLSKATDLVVVGEKGGGNKLEEAEKFGTQTMNLEEFTALVQEFRNEQ